MKVSQIVQLEAPAASAASSDDGSATLAAGAGTASSHQYLTVIADLVVRRSWAACDCVDCLVCCHEASRQPCRGL